MFLAGLAFQASCTVEGDRSSPGVDGGGEGACSGDPECPTGQVCEGRRCVPICVIHEQCQELHGSPDKPDQKWICQDDHCVNPSTLPDGGFSDTGDGTRDAGSPIIICDPQCADNEICIRKTCVDRCEAPLGCPDGDVTLRLEGYTIDVFEASHPDATADRPGCNETRACSSAGKVPWTRISWSSAAKACQNGGKRLCTAEEWRRACAGTELRNYPYGNTFLPGACNGGTGRQARPWPTGSGPQCVTPEGVHDLAGNVAEWIGEEFAGNLSQRATLGGSLNNASQQLRCDHDLHSESATTESDLIGFRCCKD